MEKVESIRGYLKLMYEYLEGGMETNEFCRKYFKMHQGEEGALISETHQKLEYMFAQADSHAEPEFRDEKYDIGEEELRETVQETATYLEKRLDELE